MSIAGYQALSVLGAGGHATVWRARAPGGQQVALKVVSGARARVTREVAALRALPAGVAPRLIDITRSEDGEEVLVLELLEGETLHARLVRTGPLPPAEALDLLETLARQTGQVHAAGWIHRDLKPSNVFLSTDGVRLLDFGLARPIGEDEPVVATAMTLTQQALGTPAYMAPELAADARGVDGRCDVYALGVIFYELLSGRTPFVAEEAEIVRLHASTPPPPAPAPFTAAVAAALAKHRDDRPPTAQAFAERCRKAWREVASPAAAATTVAVALPTVLLAIRTRQPLPHVAQTAAKHNVRVLRVRRGWLLAVAPGGLTDGRACAHALVEDDAGATVVLHTGPVVLIDGARLSATGAAVDDPTSWVGGDRGPGVHETGAGVTPRRSSISVEEPPPPLTEPALRGRAEALARLAEGADAARAGVPTITTLLGDEGTGRTRLLREAEALARDRGLEASFVDDLDRATPAVLEALEQQALEERAAPVWVCVAALPSLLEIRPGWGGRAGRHDVIKLEPLGADDCRALWRDVLQPVEYIPGEVLAELVRDADGLPLIVVEHARLLRAGGLIRRAGAGWVLHAEQLGSLPAVERAAGRLLEALPPAVRELAEAAAVLGLSFRREDLAALRRRVDEAAELDDRAGLERLAGLCGPTGFHHERVRKMIEAHTPAGQRQRLHKAAFELFASVAGREEDAARHATAAGLRAEAGPRWLALGEASFARHQLVAADRQLTSALACLEEPALIVTALAARGRVRSRIQRERAALEDLEAARELAEQLGDGERATGLLLEQATVHDALFDYATAATLVNQALARGAGEAGSRWEARACLAQGRNHHRAGEYDETVACLRKARRLASCDGEVAIISLVLEGAALTYAARFHEARTVLDEAVSACVAAGDRFHLSVAHANRFIADSNLADIGAAEADGRAAVALARELGQPRMERIPTHNLAELYHWQGRTAEAIPLARRAQALMLRHHEGDFIPHHALLLARLAVAAGDEVEARAQLDWIRAHGPASTEPSILLLIEVVAQAANDSGPTWAALVERAWTEAQAGQLEEIVLVAASRCPSEGLAWMQRALAGAPSAVWRPRLEAAVTAAQQVVVSGARSAR